MIRPNSNKLCTNLDQPHQENGVLSHRPRLANEPNACTLRDIYIREMQKARVAQMNIYVPGGCLQ